MRIRRQELPRFTAVAVWLGAAAAFIAVSGGCETTETVRNPYNNPNWTYEQVPGPTPVYAQPQNDGPLEAIGDALFGWMDGGNSRQNTGGTVPIENTYRPTVRQ